MDMGSEQWSSPSSSTSSPDQNTAALWASPPKRPAGRTKFKETRHPVYRGVRRRGGAGRWVCEVRVPGKRGERLWLGTYVTEEAAARGHDAAMLALGGRSAMCLNFADSARLLAVPAGHADLAGVRRAALVALVPLFRYRNGNEIRSRCGSLGKKRLAALAAVAEFQCREAAYCAETIPADEVDTSSVSAENASSSSEATADGMLEVPADAVLGTGSDMFDFELDMSGEMDLGSYYADFAEGMLLEPPPPEFTEVCWDGGAEQAALWGYY
ncbi:hypothetical protein ACQ4PT_036762 [Festuca glaucescens]